MMIKFSRIAFLLRFPSIRCLLSPRRSLTTERTNYVSVTMDPEFGGSVAVVKMQKKPVNSLCVNHALELKKTFTDLENNENVRAVILTSGLPGVFCAGLDLKSMYGRTFDEIYTFWGILQDTCFKMYSSRLINIAAMNGHCIAGGTILAFSADYRVFATRCKIGLNEVKLGLPIPFFHSQMMVDLAGLRQADRLQQLGLLIESPEALKLGLVDETAPMDEVLDVARRQVTEWLDIPDAAREMIKGRSRKKKIEAFEAKKEAESRLYATLATSPHIQALVSDHLENLKKRKER